MRRIGIDQLGLLGGVAFGLALGGCNSFDDKPAPGSGDGTHLVIPVDTRPAVASPVPLRPISGGTLSVTADGSAAIVADSERDLVTIVALPSFVVRSTIALQAGDEPGRSIEDADKHVHVALRGGGAIVSIDPVAGTIIDRRAVCKAPRGLAFDAASKLLHVACSEGKLVSLPAAGGDAVRTLTLEPDLRDVLVRGSELWVSTFKSAELLRIDSAGGTLNNRVTIPQGAGQISQPAPPDEFGNRTIGGQVSKEVVVDPGVAWRTVSTQAGGAVIVHQEAVADEIEISEPSETGSAYGGGGGGVFDCSGIVKTAVTTVGPDGSVVSAQVSGAPLPVDVAVSPNQAFVAVAHAGPADMMAPRPSVEFLGDSGDIEGGGSFGPASFGGGTLAIHSMTNLRPEFGCMGSEGSPTMESVTAVAFTPDGKLLAQVQQPPQLLLIQELPWGGASSLALPGEERIDTGHELFHRDSGGGIACASCHPEGGEDGHTWKFADTGVRRTQALHVGLKGTAPFHWAGDLPNVGSLMTEVFVQRMGGVRQSAERLDTLTDWLFSLEAPPALRDANDESAVRGKELFNSAAVGCASCHSGEKLTNNQSMAIDTLKGTRLQVPSLVAVGYRAPFMHTGCAATLAGRFDPACGGDAHGNTSQLSPAELGDLVAYLETL